MSDPTCFEVHTEASKLFQKAALLEFEARQVYYQAGEKELEALALTKLEAVPTYGILAVSAASCFFRAGAFQKAKDVAHTLASEPLLNYDEHAYDQLAEIVDSAHAELTKDDEETDEG